MNEVNLKENLGNKVVKSNELIQRAKTDLTLSEQKLVNYLISLIKPKDDELKVYEIKAADFAKITGIDSTHMYRDFKKIMESIEKKSFWFEDEREIVRIYWVMKPRYIKGEGKVRMRLDPDLKEYLIGLQNNFTSYELYNILSLKSKYSLSLYELFKMHSFKHILKINLDELKEKIGANLDSYKKFGIFKQRILETSLDNINKYTDIKVSYQCLDSHQKLLNDLRGRKVVYIKFIIKTKGETDRLTLYEETTYRLFDNEQLSDQVPHQLSFDTDNETAALFDDTTNQRIN